MDIIDAIIRHERIRHDLMNELSDAIREMGDDKLEIKTEYDESDAFAFGSKSDVSPYNRGDLAIVYLQSNVLPHLFENFMETNNVIVFEEKEYPGVDYVEDGMYKYEFNFPEDVEKIRGHVLMLVKILLIEE